MSILLTWLIVCYVWAGLTTALFVYFVNDIEHKQIPLFSYLISFIFWWAIPIVLSICIVLGKGMKR